MNTLAFDYGFAPDEERSRLLDAKAHAMLADSLEHIQTQADHVLGATHQLSPLIARIRAGHRVGPACFGMYYQLAMALMNDQIDDARSIAARLSQFPSMHNPFRLIALGELADEDIRLYQTLMDTDPQASFTMLAPTPEMISTFKERYLGAFGMMQTALPTLTSEISGLVREICMVTCDPDVHYQFDGGSSYMLWGGMFINIASPDSTIQIIGQLAHESAHTLLFGYSLDEALVSNEDNEFFASPLRIDPRPMDGIYHATFVSARMHWAMSQLLAFASLSQTDRDLAEESRRTDIENFKAGYETVARHGNLTATGHAVMDGACRYMNEFH